MTEQLSMSLNKLIADYAPPLKEDVMIYGISHDSRQVNQGDVFIAYQGHQYHGARFIDDVIASGASVVISDVKDITPDIPTIYMDNVQQHLGDLAARFYQYPSQSLQVIGVTGTNGKTTVSQMVAYALNRMGQKTAVIGTLGYGVVGQPLANTLLTTPDSIQLQSLLFHWQQAGLQNVAMEVSAHALSQGRVNGMLFDVAVFTNLSVDHLDYYACLEDYAKAKQSLFTMDGLGIAVINMADPFGIKLASQLADDMKVFGYCLNGEQHSDNMKLHSFVQAELIQQRDSYTELLIDKTHHLKTSLLGECYLENMLAAYTTLLAIGVQPQQAINALKSFTTLPGRMESFHRLGMPLLIVDYAHNPDALKRTLGDLRKLCSGTLFCVFGCGGERDESKRSIMGTIAESYADQVVITNDNPRNESPMKIVEDILQGCTQPDQVKVVLDRKLAITNTFLSAKANDVILIAGKGHEATQTTDHQVVQLSDRIIADELINSTEAL